MHIRRLVHFPYVLVLLQCDACKRAGSYRLARLAVKYGAEILLDDLLLRLSSDCPWRDDPRGTCQVRFADLPPQRPPDLPPVMRRLRVVQGGRSAAVVIADAKKSPGASRRIESTDQPKFQRWCSPPWPPCWPPRRPGSCCCWSGF
jgi:hypothetical protein